MNITELGFTVSTVKSPQSGKVISLTIQCNSDHPSGINTAVLRHIHSQLLTGKSPSTLDQLTSFVNSISYSFPSKLNGRRILSDLDYQKIGHVYVAAFSNGFYPAKVISLWTQAPRPTVSRWIKIAKQKGYIPNIVYSWRQKYESSKHSILY